MKTLRNGLLTLGAFAVAAPLWAQTPPAPPPPAPQAQPPRMPGGMNAPRPPSDFQFRAPVGMQARFTYMSINGHKDDLKLTDAQMKQLNDLWQKAQQDDMDRNEKTMTLRQNVETLAGADTVDMAKVETAVRALQAAQADDMLADIRLNQSLLKVLTAEQRNQLKTLPPTFGMPGMPGMGGMRPPMPRPMPRPGGMPGMPGMPGGPGAPGTPGTPPGPPPAP